MEKKNSISILPDGGIEVLFAKPIKVSLASLLYFGNLNGLSVVVAPRNRIIGLRFRDEEVLRSFYNASVPEKLAEVLEMVKELKKNANK